MSPAWQADCLPLSHLESPKSHYKWFVLVNLLNDWNRHSTKDFQMTKKLVKICLISLFTKEMKIKTTMRYWYTTIKWPKFRHLTTFGKDVEWEGTEYTHSTLTLRGSLEVFSSVWMSLEQVPVQKIRRVKNIPWAPPKDFKLYSDSGLENNLVPNKQNSQWLSFALRSGSPRISLPTDCFLPATYFCLRTKLFYEDKVYFIPVSNRVQSDSCHPIVQSIEFCNIVIWERNS